MNYPRVATRYSKALLELSIEQNVLDVVRADAALTKESVLASGELALLLKNPVVKSHKKQAILKEVFGGKVSELFEGFIMLLANNGREEHLAKVCEKFEKDVLAHKGIIEAHVVSAVALSPSDKEKLVSKLSSQLSKEVLLTEEVDATVIGGLKLEVEGYQIDNTISGKLRALRNVMID